MLNIAGVLQEAGAKPAHIRLNINKAVDKEWEGRALSEVAKAPVAALQGLTPAKCAFMKS